MNFNIGKLYFSATPFAFWLGVVTLLAVAVLCAVAIYRSSRRWRTGLLEAIRFVTASLIVIILWAPQIREVKEPEDEPMVLILYDRSFSMETVDAKVATIFGTVGDKKIIPRKDWVEFAIDDSLWKGLEESGDGTKVIKKAFSVDDSNKSKNRPGSDYYKAIQDTLEEYDNLKGIIVIGDGDYNTGDEPLRVAQVAAKRRVPLYTIGVGKTAFQPDLEIISLSAPKFGIVGEAMQIPFSIRSSINKDVKTVITLTDKTSKRIESKQVNIPANSTFNDSLLFRLDDKEREYDFEFKVGIHSSEVITENNVQRFKLNSRKEDIKVLVIDSRPRWEYRFIRNALSRDPGVDLDCLLLHPKLGAGYGNDYIQKFPATFAELQKYDVVFLGDVGVGPDQLTVEQANMLKGLVENQASGLVFIPGSQGNIFSLLQPDPKDASKPITELADLIPVILDKTNSKGHRDAKPAPLSLTDRGKGSLLTMLGDSSDENANIWRRLPGFNWYAPVIKAKIGTDVLAVHSSKRTANNQRMPMLVTQNYGSGKVLFLAHDSAWKWRRGVEDLYHYRFWGQVARWMSYKRNRAAGENLRLHFSKDKPKPGDRITVTANAFDKNGAPLGIEGSVTVEIQTPAGKVITTDLKREEGDWGAYVGYFDILETGSYGITSYTSVDPTQKVSTSIETLTIELEKIGQPANFDMLKEVSSVSKGKFVTGDQIPELAEMIKNTPIREPEPTTTDLRSAKKEETSIPMWLLGSTIGLFAIFWVGRKMNGTF